MGGPGNNIGPVPGLPPTGGERRRWQLASATAVALLLAIASPGTTAAQAPPLNDNGKIAFVSFRDFGDAEIYTMNPDGTQQTRLTHNTLSPPGPPGPPGLLDFWPSWSPDGRKIIWTSFRGSGAATTRNIWIMNADGSGQTRVTTGHEGDLDPAFSPDGRRIVFVRQFGPPTDSAHPPPSRFNIFAVNANGTREVNLTHSAANETEPAWSPDGRKIVFERRVAPGNHEIFIMNADGSHQRRLTKTPDRSEGHPGFSPDGKKIIYDTNFHSPPGVPGSIYTMNLDGSGVTRLTSNRTDRHGLASFSPDGTKIAFTASENIWTMNANGANQTRVTTTPVPDIQPAWQPVSRLPGITVPGRQRLSRVLRRGLSAVSSCRGGGSCRALMVVVVSGTTRRRLHLHSRILGRVTLRFASGARRTVRVKFSGAAVRLLRSQREIRVTFNASVPMAALGPSHTSSAVTLTR